MKKYIVKTKEKLDIVVFVAVFVTWLLFWLVVRIDGFGG